MILTIDDTIFGIFGGLLIGVAAAIMWIYLGRITGISGIFAEIFSKESQSNKWRVAFILGLIFGGLIFRSFTPREMGPFFLNYDDGLLAAIAGLFVGFGSIYASGCTSGHGVCGLSRLSKRSIVAVGLFIVSGILTVTFLSSLTY